MKTDMKLHNNFVGCSFLEGKWLRMLSGQCTAVLFARILHNLRHHPLLKHTKRCLEFSIFLKI